MITRSRGYQASLGSPLLEETETGKKIPQERAAPRDASASGGRSARRRFSFLKRICFQQVCRLRSSGRSRHLVGYWATVPLFLCSVKLTLFHSVKRVQQGRIVRSIRSGAHTKSDWKSCTEGCSHSAEPQQVCQYGCKHR